MSPPEHRPVSSLIEHLALRIAEDAEGSARVEMTVEPYLRNRNGALHGGIICCLADVAIGRSVAALVGPAFTIATVNLTVTFVSPCLGDEVVAEGRIFKRGRTLAHGETTITANGKLAARATGTWHLSPRVDAQTRNERR